MLGRYALTGTLAGGVLAGLLAAVAVAVSPTGTEVARNQVPPAAVTQPGAASTTMVPRSPARLAWFYKPPQLREDADVVLNDFDVFILTRGDEAFLKTLRAKKPRAKVLQYFLLNQIIKPADGRPEQRNNAAYMPGDFARISSEHPDWFLRDQNGSPVVEGGKYYRMDPGNEEWRTFWITRVQAANSRWDGVFLDNLDLSLAGLQRDGVWLPSYPTDEIYTATLAEFLGRIHNEVSEPVNKPLYANLVNPSRDHDGTRLYLPNLDGAMDEGWALGWGRGHISTSAWARHLARVDDLLANGKRVILVAQGDRWDLERQAFAYGSYLLVAGPRVSFRYTRSGSYGHPWIFDNYEMPLGAPQGPRFRLPTGDFRRQFSNGCVTVYPQARHADITTGSCPTG